MISNQKELFALVDSIFKPLGYVKKRDTWYLYTEESILFFSIGKEPYSGKYGQTFGCFLKEIDTYDGKEYPDYGKSHLRISLSFYVRKDYVEPILDLENLTFTKNEREDAIKILIEKYAVPFLNEIKSKAGIKKAFEKDPRIKDYMNVNLKKVLDIPFGCV